LTINNAGKNSLTHKFDTSFADFSDNIPNRAAITPSSRVKRTDNDACNAPRNETVILEGMVDTKFFDETSSQAINQWMKDGSVLMDRIQQPCKGS